MPLNTSLAWVEFKFTSRDRNSMIRACGDLGTEAQISEFIKSCEAQLSGYVSSAVSGMLPQAKTVKNELSQIFSACARAHQVLSKVGHVSRLEIEHAVQIHEFQKNNKPPDALIEGMLFDLERVLSVRESRLIQPMPEAVRKSRTLAHIAWHFQRVFRVKASPSKSGRFKAIAEIVSASLHKYEAPRLQISESALKFALKGLGNTNGCRVAPKAKR